MLSHQSQKIFDEYFEKTAKDDHFSLFKYRFQHALNDIKDLPFCEMNQQITFCTSKYKNLCFLCLKNGKAHVCHYQEKIHDNPFFPKNKKKFRFINFIQPRYRYRLPQCLSIEMRGIIEEYENLPYCEFNQQITTVASCCENHSKNFCWLCLKKGKMHMIDKQLSKYSQFFIRLQPSSKK